MNYYELLKIEGNASEADIKRAFKRQMFIHHPDKSSHPDAHAIATHIIQAYKTLSNSELRKQYDQCLKFKEKVVERHTQKTSIEQLLSQAGMIEIECEQCGGKTYHERILFMDKNQIYYVECDHCGLIVCIQ